MKKLLISVVALFVLCSVQASAQVKFGLTGGMNFNTAKIENLDMKAKAGWNAGVTLFIDLPLGLSLQPSLLYSQDGVNVGEGASVNMNSLKLPVSVQWGPDLIILRPFIDVTPYVSYSLGNSFSDIAGDVMNEDYNKFQYGVGVGAGVNIWKLQVIARYNWNFGSIDNFNMDNVVEGVVGDVVGEEKGANFGGISVSVAFLF